MKPMMILPPDVMDDANIQLLRDNDICVVVSSDPSKVRFVDPIPAVSNRTEMENAAIQLSRKILAKDINYQGDKQKFAAMYVDLLVKRTPLDPNVDVKKKHKEEIFEYEKADEIRRLAREEAKAERDAAKAAKKK